MVSRQYRKAAARTVIAARGNHKASQSFVCQCFKPLVKFILKTSFAGLGDGMMNRANLEKKPVSLTIEENGFLVKEALTT